MHRLGAGGAVGGRANRRLDIGTSSLEAANPATAVMSTDRGVAGPALAANASASPVVSARPAEAVLSPPPAAGPGSRPAIVPREVSESWDGGSQVPASQDSQGLGGGALTPEQLARVERNRAAALARRRERERAGSEGGDARLWTWATGSACRVAAWGEREYDASQYCFVLGVGY